MLTLVRLLPNTWTRIPGTLVEVYAAYDYVILRGEHGIWNVGMVHGRLLVRVVYPDRRRSWPRPRPPLPRRRP
jgi:hypothetical protein